ncbi:MAG: SH3 beta-barrel fold-containing protein [Alistipes senegalensis]|nr:SH3 beta-barrel fold-containing protein [Alistipes senegalensis]
MNRNYLIRTLVKKFNPFVGMSAWQLEAAVTDAVNEATAECDELEGLIDQLHSRIVRFSYRKADGSIREAIGTLKPSILDKLVAETKSGRRKSSRSNQVTYYDLDCEDWRCFNPENFISMD